MQAIETESASFETIGKILSDELQVKPFQVMTAIKLLDDGSTVPFIARYRKEMTGGMSDDHLRLLAERLTYLRELEDRRNVILSSVEEQGKLTPELRTKIQNVLTKSELEDIYLPFKPRRRTKAQIARESGLEPLADLLLKEREKSPEEYAAAFVDPEKNVPDSAAALEGAGQILMERFSEHADLLGALRRQLQSECWIISSASAEGNPEKADKFSDYFNYQEKIDEIPSHRMLALLRGRKEGILKLKLEINPYDDDRQKVESAFIAQIARTFEISFNDEWLIKYVQKAWNIKLRPSLEIDLMLNLKRDAEEEAIRVFASNLKNLLLAAPAGTKNVMGLDPGFRTGVKLCVVDATGKVTFTGAIFPHAPQDRWNESMEILEAIIKQFKVQLIAIGNGTASRETDRLVIQTLKKYKLDQVQKIVVSEAGASVYSASELASKELPDLDVSVRGAVSIARRLQDPLAELVKIDPKSIGVGQYQHDVDQSRLMKSLQAVVEDCVNAVGIDVNTASAELLSYTSGLTRKLAENIIEYRFKNGAFKSREELQSVKDFGPKTYELAAGFLRIRDGLNPLDASSVHPERYGLVTQMLKDLNTTVEHAVGKPEVVHRLKPDTYVSDEIGLPTIQDILRELEKPGRDPRGQFVAPTFKEGVESIADLKPGMKLEGSVTNVAKFGAFVDIGVHQDGLVHISELADQYVEDPHDFIKTGDIVKVRVLEVDAKRNRISLSMRQGEKKKNSHQPSAGFNRIQNL